jgi:GntR family phosphonate transport system transcriptional regulator
MKPSRDGIALWRSVSDELERAIAQGLYAMGARLPGELEIAERFRVNRHTVRRAIAELAGRGIVRAARGSGTYVAAPRIAYPIGPRTRFSEIVGGVGREAGGKLIESREEIADNDIARKLSIKPGAPVTRLELLRHADKVPLCVGTSWLSAARFPDGARVYAAKRSMTGTLAQFGVTDYRRASTRVVAGLADLNDAMRLDVRPGSPVLIVDSIDVDDGGVPLLTTRTRFAAERVELVFKD